MINAGSDRPSVVFVGHVVIDHNKVEQTSYVRWGSPAMFMMRYFRSNFVINPTIIASYGPDFLQYAGDANLLPKKPNLERTIVYENIVINGHRTQYCHGADAKVPELTPEIVDALSTADLLFLAPLTPAFSAEYIDKLMPYVKPACLKTIIPQGYLRKFGHDGLVGHYEFEAAAKILPHFDLCVISDDDHPQSDEVSRQWKQMSPQTNFIVTHGYNDARIILLDGLQDIPTKPVPPEEIVDSVGLGDTFSAATAYCLYQTGDLVEAVNAGHVAAREKLLSPVVR